MREPRGGVSGSNERPVSDPGTLLELALGCY